MLFNTKLYNTGIFNGGANPFGSSLFLTDRIVFNNFSLSDGTVMICQELVDSGPSRQLIGDSVPRGHGEFLLADYFRERTITAKGIAIKSTFADMDTFLDTLRKNLSAREGTLDINEANGTTKRYTATMDNFDDVFAERQHFHITFCPWSVRFRCKNPFAYSRLYSSVFESITTSPTNKNVQNLGTIEAEPIVYLIFSAASSVTAVSVENDTTGEQIAYSGSISAGDILMFDAENKVVEKNGTEVDYSGTFPTLSVGRNLMIVTVTGSSFTASLTIKHRTTYL